MKDAKMLRLIRTVSMLAGCVCMFLAMKFLYRNDTASRAVSFVLLILGLALVYVPSLLIKKRLEQLEDEPEAYAEDELADTDDADDEPLYPGVKAPVLMMGFPNDRIYAVFETETNYVFCWLGNEMGGSKRERLPEKAPDDRYIPGNKDLVIAKRDVDVYDLKMRHCISTQIPNCAALHLTVNGKKKKFIVLGEGEERELDDFFSAVRYKKTGTNERYAAKAERRERMKQRDIELAEYVNERHSDKLQTLTLALIIVIAAAILISFGAIFIGLGSVRVWMWILCAAEVLLFLLGIAMPDQTSFMFTLTEAKKLNMKRRYNVMFVMLAGSLPLLGISDLVSVIRLSDHMTVVAVLAAIQLALVFICCKEARAHPVTMLLWTFVFFSVNFGLVPTVNALTDDMANAEVRSFAVERMYESDGDNNVYVTIEGEEVGFDVAQSEYDTLKVGDSVCVTVSRGGLGIEYAVFGNDR